METCRTRNIWLKTKDLDTLVETFEIEIF